MNERMVVGYMVQSGVKPRYPIRLDWSGVARLWQVAIGGLLGLYKIGRRINGKARNGVLLEH